MNQIYITAAGRFNLTAKCTIIGDEPISSDGKENMNTTRRDNNNRPLLNGETQRKDGCYQYAFTGADGKRKFVYSWRLVPSDPVPKGKRYTKSLREMEQEIRDDQKDGIISGKKLTLDSLFDKFISMKEEVRKTTKDGYKELYDRYVRDGFGAQDVKKIKHSAVKQFYNTLKTEKKLSGGTIKRINCLLKQCFDMAVNDDILRKNPCDGVIRELGKTGSMKAKKKTALSCEQQAELIAFIKESKYSFWFNIIVFLFGTGCRIGEVAGLRWQDVDFEENVIHIRKNISTVSYSHILQDPKTDAGIRDIPMLPEIREALIAQKNTDDNPGQDSFVFLNKAGNVIDRNCFNRMLKRVVRDYNKIHEGAGKSLPEDLSAHSLRHSFGTRMCENDVNVKVTQALMGHAKAGTTMDVYTDMFRDKVLTSFSSLEGKLPLGQADAS